jgi:hypothetical protein
VPSRSSWILKFPGPEINWQPENFRVICKSATCSDRRCGPKMGSRVHFSGAVVPLVVLALWQLFASTGLLRYEYLPAPLEVLAALVELARTGELVRDVMYTLGVALMAAAITLTLGAAVGLAIGLLPTLRDYVMASIDFLRTIPAVTLVPVAVLTFGPAATTELMLAVYAALWPIVLSTASAAAVHPRQYDVARILRFSRVTTVRKIHAHCSDGAAGDVAHARTHADTAVGQGHPALADSRSHARSAGRVGHGAHRHTAGGHLRGGRGTRTVTHRKPATLRLRRSVGSATAGRCLRLPDERLVRQGRPKRCPTFGTETHSSPSIPAPRLGWRRPSGTRRPALASRGAGPGVRRLTFGSRETHDAEEDEQARTGHALEPFAAMANPDWTPRIDPRGVGVELSVGTGGSIDHCCVLVYEILSAWMWGEGR